MKRMKALVCCAAAACLAMVLAGCSSQQSYTPPEKSATVSSPAIGKSGTLRVGVNAGSPPLAGSPSSSSKIVGIDVDVAAALADQLGLKLEIVDVGTDPEAALKEGKVDVAMGIGSEIEVSFWRSPAYLPKGVALFSTPANATVPTKASSPKIAAQVSSTSSWQVTNEFGQDALVSENDLKSAFAALADGSAQYVAADAVIGMYAAHSGGYDAQIVALMQQPGGYCVGVLEANTELQAAVKDALAALTDGGIVSVIEKKWLGTDIDASSLPLTTGASSAKTDESKTSGDESDGGENAPAAEGDEEGNVESNAGRNAVQPTA
ncbi:substrate-binding periplasmic protein [Gordonibacter urolithinfaciens]|uniref:Transporter substrate-binding domain-containing protein n=1 Tax=Gordonibacter urolithinfaciens TaxID=1335613 RepID=A0A6N8IGH4_9ACTN|nr:transporter substrate-binding domain-containing protein [Gordonibacter urolithinfaciens]MVM55146.1 transporter substrate-binding domain-containing protein [Gordonibacter urolithinfaciens]MVN14925.1 transporter substrate-binding domain-containing protein [Gordonibacter urolithinfaciens]MVN39767.1 transporter substrate-binding domain-containing protein [Gordonibacter urolithinfaciens]MVN56769.1 transporter substrate-binding domain-containing protein [Gordonibacter urolithinfaciens]MVN62266.1 